MEYRAAPMEGITDYIWRKIHAAHFGGVDRYYTPFLSPTREVGLGERELREVLPEHNEGISVIPQLLTRDAEAFCKGARQLMDLGYREVDLNLGCPSGTVTAKGKGAALLGRHDDLKALLDGIFEAGDLSVSVKLRLGVKSPEEFPAILELLAGYPIRELILHPRTAAEKYTGRPHAEAIRLAAETAKCPLCANAGFFSPADIALFRETFPTVPSVMAGRGLIADPALFRDAPATREEIIGYTKELSAACLSAFGSDRNALFRMKEHWLYLRRLWQGSDSYTRAIGRARTLSELRDVTASMMSRLCMPGRADWSEENISFRP